MHKKNIRKLALALGLVALIGVGSTLAYLTDKDSKTNTFTMGKVGISLTEPEYSKNHPDYTVKNVIPGNTITKDPTVTVATDSADCYIRVKVSLSSSNGLNPDIYNQLLETDVDGNYKYLDINENDWLKSGEYFYYIGSKNVNKNQGVLKAGDVVKLFNNVTIPLDWDEQIIHKDLSIEIVAEAIQADNFEPSNLNGQYGWYYNDLPVTVDNYDESINQGN